MRWYRGCASIGVPVEVHEPEICLSIPLLGLGHRRRHDLPRQAAVLVAVRCRTDAPARLVALQANPRALRSYNRDIKTLVRRQHRVGRGREASGRRQHRGDAGLRQSGADQPDRGMGRRRADRGQPRRRHPLGHLHHDLGQSRPAGRCAQAAHPGGRGEQSGRPEAAGAGRARAARPPSAPTCSRAGSCRRCRW